MCILEVHKTQIGLLTNAGEEKASPKGLPWGVDRLRQKVKFLSTPSADSLEEK